MMHVSWVGIFFYFIFLMISLFRFVFSSCFENKFMIFWLYFRSCRNQNAECCFVFYMRCYVDGFVEIFYNL